MVVCVCLRLVCLLWVIALVWHRDLGVFFAGVLFIMFALCFCLSADWWV